MTKGNYRRRACVAQAGSALAGSALERDAPGFYGVLARSLALRWLLPLAFGVAVLAVGPASAESGAKNIDGAVFDDWAAVSDSDLSRNSGGAELTFGDVGFNLASNSATVTGNKVEGNVKTGEIIGNSMNDVSGINSLMFNTGNNVNFQSNMQINIFLR